ncbi:hypothetical protein ACP76Z_02535 [Vibrio cholerae]
MSDPSPFTVMSQAPLHALLIRSFNHAEAEVIHQQQTDCCLNLYIHTISGPISLSLCEYLSKAAMLQEQAGIDPRWRETAWVLHRGGAARARRTDLPA